MYLCDSILLCGFQHPISTPTMLLAFALAASAKAGSAPEEAIHDAFLLRFRPNLMTMCGLPGGGPLMLGTGIGSEIRQPLG
jgi:multidrug efflux pump